MQERRLRVDRRGGAGEHGAVDADDSLPRRADDPLAGLARQDLDPLSVAELEARIAALEAEIARVRLHVERSVNHRASADALFKR